MDAEDRALYGNEMFLFVGPPATGKTMIIKVVNKIYDHELMMQACPVTKDFQPKLNTAPDSITLEALTHHLARTYKRYHKFSFEGKDKFYIHCSLTFLSQELGVLLRKHTEDVINVINQAYDADKITRITKGAGSDEIRNVCLSMLAGTTPGFVKEALDHNMFDTGFTSRFIVLYENGPRFYREHPGYTPEQLQGKLDITNHLAKCVTNEFGEVTMSKECAAWKKEYYESGQFAADRPNHDQTLNNYYGRKHSHWKKLMQIMHFSEEYSGREISLATAKRALNALNRAEDKMHLAFTSIGRNRLHQVMQQILVVIQQKTPGGGIFRSTLIRQFSKDLGIQEIAECLDSLEQGKQVTRTNDVYKMVKV